jgi:hypothetical protein
VSGAYRVRQFIRATGAWIWPEEVEEAFLGRYLSPQAVSLFRSMPRYDQQHALGVFRTLQQGGHDDRDLLAAALLHDVGKSMPRRDRSRLPHRVVAVLMRAVRPGLLEQFGRDEPGSWRRPFYVQLYHAAFGAALAQRAGCSSTTVDLIRRHEDPHEQVQDSYLAALQAADSVN